MKFINPLLTYASGSFEGSGRIIILPTMNKHICDSLHSSWLVLVSDEEQPVVIELCVGFNVSGALVISADLYDYDEPEYECSTAAIVNVDDAFAMARRHKVRYSDLPRFISDCMEEWDSVINPTLRDVRDCFKEITESLLDEGCRFRIKRTYGKYGYMCC